MDGCPRFAKAYLGRKRWGEALQLLYGFSRKSRPVDRLKAFEENIFGPGTLVRNWGTLRWRVEGIVTGRSQ